MKNKLRKAEVRPLIICPQNDVVCHIRGFGFYCKFNMTSEEGTPFTVSRTVLQKDHCGSSRQTRVRNNTENGLG